MTEKYKSVSLDRTAAELVAVMGEQRLESVVARLKEKNLTVATAESCTGGLVGKLLTDVSGVSAVYLGGVISYTNQIKTDVLGVRADTIEKYTEVSVQTAIEMAERVREKFSSDIGVSVTGFAGPGGGNDNDPVGTVYIAVATKDGTRPLRLSLEPDSDRAEIRRVSAHVILAMLEKIIAGI